MRRDAYNDQAIHPTNSHKGRTMAGLGQIRGVKWASHWQKGRTKDYQWAENGCLRGLIERRVKRSEMERRKCGLRSTRVRLWGDRVITVMKN